MPQVELWWDGAVFGHRSLQGGVGGFLTVPQERVPVASMGNVMSIFKPLLLALLLSPAPNPPVFSHLVPNCIQSLPHGSRDLIPCLLLASFNSYLHTLTRKSSQAHWWPIVLAHVLSSPQKLPLSFLLALTVTSFRLDASSSEATLDM